MSESGVLPERQRLFAQILSTYLALILLVLLLNVFFYAQACRRVEENTLENQRLLLSQTAGSLEQLVSGAVSAGRQILASPQTASLLYCREEDFTIYKKLSVTRLQEELIRRIAHGEGVEAILVLFNRSGVAASNSGIHRGSALSAELQRTFGLAQETLDDAFARRRTFLLDPDSGKSVVLCYDSIIRNRPDAVCLLAVNTQNLLRILVGASDEGVTLWLVGEDGAVLSPGTEALPEEAADALAGSAEFSLVSGGRERQYLRSDLGIPGWKLVAAVDMDYFRRPLRRLQRVYFGVTSVALLAGIALAVFFARRRTNRVARITRRYIEQSGAARSELAAMEADMQRLLAENGRYRDNIAAHLQEIRESWLIRVMHGKVSVEAAFRLGCEDYQTGFEGDSFAVLCLDPVGYTALPEGVGDAAEDVYDLVNYSLDAFAGELLSRSFHSQRCYYNNVFYYILNPRGGGALDEDALKEIARSLLSFVGARVGVTLRCYVSRPVRGAAGLASAYEEARDGMAQMETYGIPGALYDRSELAAAVAALKERKEPDKTLSVQVEAVRREIDARFSDPMLTVSRIAEDFHISQSYLLRIFRKDLGMGVLEYISQRRVTEAKRLLKETKLTVNAIAEQVGYTNSLALIRAFRKQENLTPSEYRRLF